jgi:hypothetical protein
MVSFQLMLEIPVGYGTKIIIMNLNYGKPEHEQQKSCTMGTCKQKLQCKDFKTDNMNCLAIFICTVYLELSLLDEDVESRRLRAGVRLRRRGGERPPPRPPRPTGDRLRPPRPTGERLRPPRRGGERRPPRGDGERLRPRGEGERRRPPRGDGERRRAPRGDGERRRFGDGALLGAGRGIRTGAAVTSYT